MTKTTDKYSPEVRERAMRMVLDGKGQQESRWSAILSISSKIGWARQRPFACRGAVAQVSEDAGYGPESAFPVAFKRTMGRTPRQQADCEKR